MKKNVKIQNCQDPAYSIHNYDRHKISDSLFQITFTTCTYQHNYLNIYTVYFFRPIPTFFPAEIWICTEKSTLDIKISLYTNKCL